MRRFTASRSRQGFPLSHAVPVVVAVAEASDDDDEVEVALAFISAIASDALPLTHSLSHTDSRGKVQGARGGTRTTRAVVAVVASVAEEAVVVVVVSVAAVVAGKKVSGGLMAGVG